MSDRSPYATDDDRWAAIAGRDRDADGAFFCAVRTTGIYCRPDCPSRMPKRRNVAFFDTRAEAEAAGYRPCKRCRPDAESPRRTHAGLIARACQGIERAERPPTLEAPAAGRAVARACAANRIALAIPCHRAVRGDGAPGGYRWGTDRKRALLEREGEAG